MKEQNLKTQMKCGKKKTHEIHSNGAYVAVHIRIVLKAKIENENAVSSIQAK